jgi:hypothetical protein
MQEPGWLRENLEDRGRRERPDNIHSLFAEPIEHEIVSDCQNADAAADVLSSRSNLREISESLAFGSDPI